MCFCLISKEYEDRDSHKETQLSCRDYCAANVWEEKFRIWGRRFKVLIAVQFSQRTYLPSFGQVLSRGLLLDVVHQPGVFGSSAWQRLELKILLHLLFEPSN